MESSEATAVAVPVGRTGPPRPVRPHVPPSVRSLSDEHQGHLAVVARVFTRSIRQWLSTRTRAEVGVSMAGAARWTWGDLLATLPDSYCGAPFDPSPLAGPGLVTVSLPLAAAVIDRMLGGPGDPTSAPPALTEVGIEVMAEVHTRVLAELARAMTLILTFDPSVERQGSRLELVRMARAASAVVVLHFDVAVGSIEGAIEVALPAADVITALDALGGTEGAGVPAGSTEAALLDAPIPLAVRFEPLAATPSTLLDLRVGDVLALPHLRSRPLTVWVGDRPLLLARAGRRGDHLAFSVADDPRRTPGALR